jgi:hypothetical protein
MVYDENLKSSTMVGTIIYIQVEMTRKHHICGQKRRRNIIAKTNIGYC